MSESREHNDGSSIPAAAVAVLERMTDGFVILDREWRYAYVNERAGELLGVPARELMGRHIWTVFPEGRGQPFERAYARVMATGVPETIEERYAPWDRWFENRIHATPSGIAILFTEVTARRRAMRWAERQTKVLELVARGAPLPRVLEEVVEAVEEQRPGSFGSVQLLDADARQLRLIAGPRLESAMRAILVAGIPVGDDGGTCGSAAATREVQVTHDVFTDPRWRHYRDAARRFGIRSCWSTPILGRDGRLLGTIALYAPADLDPSEHDQGTLDAACHLAGVAIEHAQAAEALLARERELAAISEHTPDLVMRVGRDLRYRYVNPSVERTTRIPRERWIGHTRRELPLPRESDAQWEELIERSLASGEIVEITLPPLGATRQVHELRVIPETDDAGVPQSVLVMIRDVTRQRDLEDRLRQSQKMEAVGRLAGGVAHDFNNILTAIGGFAGLALEALEPAHPARADVEQLARSTARAAELTRQLLAFSRQQHLATQPVDLNELTGRLEPMLRRLLGGDVVLTSVPAREPAVVRGDPAQLEQVVVNLAVNARDAMPRGGQLQIEVSRVHTTRPRRAEGSEVPPGDWVVLSVSDTGEGMDDATRGHLFEPFFTTKAQGKGTGLGLAMVYGIVQQASGHIIVDSAPGLGAGFHIYLPPEAEQPASSGAPRPANAEVVAEGRAARVLVVDDESSIRALVRRILERQGYGVTEARSGNDALWLAGESPEPVDLLLTDIVMPGMDGRELARRFEVLRPGTPVVLMTGYSERLDGEDQGEPARAVLEKPFTSQQLLAAVRDALVGDAGP